MAHALVAASVALLLLLGMLGCFELGRRIGLRWRERNPEEAGQPTAAIDAAVFALFGLLIAFTFSGASGRFDDRRHVAIQEANAIGTAWLRVDLLPEPAQRELRPLYRAYVESRLDVYRSWNDEGAVQAALDRGAALQARIWKTSIAAARADGNPGVISLVGASLNEMIDVTTTRMAMRMIHPPKAIFVLLFALGLASSMVAGFSMGRGSIRIWLHTVVFAVTIAASVYVIIDMEYPRVGLIRVDEIDRLLADVLAGMR